MTSLARTRFVVVPLLAQASAVPSCDVDPSATPCYTLAPDAACGSDDVKVQVVPATSVVTSTVLRSDCE